MIAADGPLEGQDLGGWEMIVVSPVGDETTSWRYVRRGDRFWYYGTVADTYTRADYVGTLATFNDEPMRPEGPHGRNTSLGTDPPTTGPNPDR